MDDDQMIYRFYKYQGAGNDFLIADNRDGSIDLDRKSTRLNSSH